MPRMMLGQGDPGLARNPSPPEATGVPSERALDALWRRIDREVDKRIADWTYDAQMAGVDAQRLAEVEVARLALLTAMNHAVEG